jgi:hypothetical protein
MASDVSLPSAVSQRTKTSLYSATGFFLLSK